MIDTQVLSLACADPSPNAKTRKMQVDAAALVARQDRVRVSSLVVLELLRAPPDVVTKIRDSGMLDLLTVYPVDHAVASEAARMLELARPHRDVCAQCFNTLRAAPCSGCHQLVSHQQKTNDALIVATAAVLRDVDTLYTYDGGMITLGGFVKTVKTVRPPSLHGPLFETNAVVDPASP